MVISFSLWKSKDYFEHMPELKQRLQSVTVKLRKRECPATGAHWVISQMHTSEETTGDCSYTQQFTGLAAGVGAGASVGVGAMVPHPPQG